MDCLHVSAMLCTVYGLVLITTTVCVCVCVWVGGWVRVCVRMCVCLHVLRLNFIVDRPACVCLPSLVSCSLEIRQILRRVLVQLADISVTLAMQITRC